MIYIVPNNKILDQLRKTILDKHKTFKEYSKINRIFKGTIFKRLRGDVAIPLSFFKNLISENVWEILDGVKIRSKSRRTTIIINKNISIQEAMFLGWFISEGCIKKKESKVFISQANKPLLKKLSIIIKESFDLSSELKIIRNIDNTFCLRLPSIFKHYLTERFGFTGGKKAYTIKLPNEIKQADKEIKLAFLASYLEGDGSVTFHKRNTNEGIFYVPEVGFSTSSRYLKDGIKDLLISLDYHPYVQYNKNNKNFNILLTRYNEVAKTFFDLNNYILNKEKIRRYKWLLSQERLMKSLSIKADKLILKAYHHFGSYEDIVSYIQEKTGYEFSWYTIRNWARGYYRQPISVVINLCDLLNEDYFTYIPKEYAGFLWINKKISKEDFKIKRSKD